MKPQDAGPLGLHFQKLLELKEWVKQQADNTKNFIVMEIHEKLDALIKDGEKKK